MQRLWSIVDHRQKTTEWSCKVIYGMLLSGIALAFSTASRILLDVELPFAFGLVAVVFAAGWGGALPAFVVTGVTIPAVVLLSAHHPFVNSINIAVIAIFSVTLAIFGARMTSLRERADFEAQRGLKREAFLQSIFDRTPAAILIADGQGQVVAINASARHIFNITADHAGQITVSEILQTPGRTAVPSEEHRVVVRGDGKHLSLTLSSTNLPLAGRVFRTVYIRDDTATIAAAEQLALLQAELQQLARATALGQLGSAIAHELNQPLALAANFATVAKTLVARGHHNGETSEALEATLQQIFRAGEVLTGSGSSSGTDLCRHIGWARIRCSPTGLA